jgi:GntR family transcriptional regulator
MLNKTHPIPLYYQLAEHLREQIHSGELRPGDRLPSERELSEQAQISRMTVRQALAYLVREGVLVARPGIGTFVAEPKLVYNALHLLGFTEEMVRQGEAASSRVLEQAVVAPPHYVTSALRLGPDEATVKIVRLRLSAGSPVLLETSYIAASLCPGLERQPLQDTSLFALVEQVYGHKLLHSHQSLEATLADDYEAQLFGIQPGTAMILLRGVTVAENERPLEYFKALYRGDRFRFELDSHRDGLPPETLGVQRVSVVMEE